MLFLVGLGLGAPDDITLKGLKAVQSSARVYLESYTAILPGHVADESSSSSSSVESVVTGSPSGLQALCDAYSIPANSIKLADREFVEQRSDEILENTEDGSDDEVNVTLLVVGDPLCATTHVDLMLRASERGTKVSVVHNASIVNAVGTCGLSVYRYGEAVSIVFFTDTWQPDSFYDKILANRQRHNSDALHTLCLLDIQVKEYDPVAMSRGEFRRNPPRFMDVHRAARQLLAVEKKRGQNAYGADTLAVGLARVGANDQAVAVGTLEEFARGSAQERAAAAARAASEEEDDLDEEERERLELGRFDAGELGPPLHSLVLCGTLTDVEQQALERWRRVAV
ncbi:diphthine methyl ester synthase [Pycnococcus provasolii]